MYTVSVGRAEPIAADGIAAGAAARGAPGKDAAGGSWPCREKTKNASTPPARHATSAPRSKLPRPRVASTALARLVTCDVDGPAAEAERFSSRPAGSFGGSTDAVLGRDPDAGRIG